MNVQDSTLSGTKLSSVGKLRKSTRNYLSWAFRHTLIPRRYKQAQWEWRWIRNFSRTLRHNRDDASNRYLVSDAEELRTQGIIVRSVEDIFDEDGLRALEEIRAIVDDKLQDEKAQTAMKESGAVTGHWDFRLHLLDRTFDISNPFVRLAIQPKLLSLVNQYLGTRSYLRWIEAWLDYPSPDEASDTQLWHRDYDDLLNVKVFVYLNDVGKESGPFCFIPRTHPQGDRRPFQDDVTYRITDAEMKQIYSPSEWKINTGPSGTVVLADTNGYHKGLKPESGHRVLLNLQYTSPTLKGWRNFSLERSRDLELNPLQKAALFR